MSNDKQTPSVPTQPAELDAEALDLVAGGATLTTSTALNTESTQKVGGVREDSRKVGVREETSKGQITDGTSNT